MQGRLVHAHGSEELQFVGLVQFGEFLLDLGRDGHGLAAVLLGIGADAPGHLALPAHVILAHVGQVEDALLGQHPHTAQETTLLRVVESDIAPQIAALARYERPKRVLIVADTFSVANGLLTPTLKIKRREIAQRYADRIESLYAEAEAEHVSE